MAYIGNNPDAIQTTIEITRFNGDAACTEFQIPQDVDDAKAIEVLVNSVQQDPDNSYSVTNGLITFSEAPSVGTNNVTVLRRTGITFTRTQIDSGDILPNAVTTIAIADGSITAAKIANGTIVTAEIADGAVTGPKLGLTAINANNIVDGSVTGPKIGLTAINANNIVDGSITGAKIALATITGDDIATEQITGNLLTANCVSGNNIVSGLALTGNVSVTGNVTVGAGTVANPAISVVGDTNTGIFFSAADTIDFAEGGTACGQFDSSANFKFNSGYGSVATAYGCRAWVNFNGTGTVAIRASGNVSSITDNGTGDYTVNFTTALADANYSAVFGCNDNGNTSTMNYRTGGTKTTAAMQVSTLSGIATLADNDMVMMSVFR